MGSSLAVTQGGTFFAAEGSDLYTLDPVTAAPTGFGKTWRLAGQAIGGDTESTVRKVIVLE